MILEKNEDLGPLQRADAGLPAPMTRNSAPPKFLPRTRTKFPDDSVHLWVPFSG